MIKNHPLINESVTPYIKKIEEKYTVDEVIAWINIQMYIMKEEDKAMNINDLADNNSFNKLAEYKKELQSLLSRSRTLKYISVTEAFKLLNKEWRY